MYVCMCLGCSDVVGRGLNQGLKGFGGVMSVICE